MKIPIENLLTIIYEIDFYKDWLPFCYKSNTVNICIQIKKISKAEKCAYFSV
jgi:hypothetical protein